MTLPVRSWAAAAASSRSSRASAWPARSWASSTLASTRYSRSLAYVGVSSGLTPRSLAQRAAAARSPWASSRRARSGGTGLSRLATAGPGAARSASLIASRAPAASPSAWRIHARVARPLASGWLSLSWRLRAMPSVACRRAASSSSRW